MNPLYRYYSVSFGDYCSRDDGVTGDYGGKIMVNNTTVTLFGWYGQVAVNGSKVIGTLSKFAPSATEISFIGSIGSASDRGEFIRIGIATNGKITVYGTQQSPSTVRFTVTYSTSNVI